MRPALIAGALAFGIVTAGVAGCTAAPAGTGDGGVGGGGSGGSGGAGAAGAGGADAAVAPSDAGYLALQGALLALYPTDEIRDLFTASTDPADANGDGLPDPVGWGPATLPAPAQRDAATALIRRIAALLPGSVRRADNTADFSGPGSSTNQANAPNGLLALGADPASLISGSSLADARATALDAYRAAAIADAAAPAVSGRAPGLTPAAAASDATLGYYVAVWAVDPSSAIGIADNIVHHALQGGLAAELRGF